MPRPNDGFGFPAFLLVSVVETANEKEPDRLPWRLVLNGFAVPGIH